MGQNDIFSVLQTLRLCGDNSFFSEKIIRKFLRDKKLPYSQTTVNFGINRLYSFGYLERKLFRGSKSRRKSYLYRLKYRYV